MHRQCVIECAFTLTRNIQPRAGVNVHTHFRHALAYSLHMYISSLVLPSFAEAFCSPGYRDSDIAFIAGIQKTSAAVFNSCIF